ncbi:MAG: RNA polymerase factor sigma-54 [Puniceicoccales bacterium]|jgi:RNA polymerase sigma-54 factor|nr:RNA polymerase factor sigma-54 [Puniceicoccales bacterium]
MIQIVDLRSDRLQIQMQRLSPSMLRSLNILQLPTTELHQLIAAEIQRNPLLDITTNDTLLPVFSLGSNANVKGTSMDARACAPSTNEEEGSSNFLENISAEYPPEDYLLAQVPDLDEDVKSALVTLVNSLDERGFLPEDVARQFEISPVDSDKNSDPLPDGVHKNVFEKAYVILRSLSPKGIGARNLRDCLQLQILKNTPLHDLITHHFDDLECRRFVKLQRKLGKTSAELRALLAPLKLLNFAPLKTITPHANPFIVPEIIFQKVDGEWTFAVNGIPEIRMSDLYKELLIRPLKGIDRKFFTENKQHAQFLIKSLQQRQNTLQKIAQYILKFQSDFLENGADCLHPQNQKQVAEFLGIHPATLSRAIQNKYAQIPRRIIPLNFFFSHGNHGSLVAQNALKETIKNIIENENKNLPLSDEKIAQILQKKGIWIMRRTVAKYRALLALPPANVRRYLSP